MKSRVVDKSEITMEMLKQVYDATTILFFLNVSFITNTAWKGWSLFEYAFALNSLCSNSFHDAVIAAVEDELDNEMWDDVYLKFKDELDSYMEPKLIIK